MPASPTWDDDRAPYWIELLDAHVPHPSASSLIYHPPDNVDPETWDAAAIVDHALLYRPIVR